MLAGTALALGLVTSTLVASTPAMAAVPGVPTSVGVTAGKKTIAVSWTAPSEPDPIHHYVATTNPGAKTCTALYGTNACTITGLTANTGYTVTVKACPTTSNTTECSADSVASATATPGPPNTPAKPTVSYTGVGGQVQITWVRPTPYAGLAGFQVTPTPAVANATGTCGVSLASSPGATTCTIGNLVAGTSYTFKVVAVGVGDTGSSLASTASNAIVAGPPNKPGKPEVVRTGDGDDLLVSWAAPTGGAPPTSYTVTANEDMTLSDGCGDNPNFRSCTVTPDDPTLSYTFQVEAHGGGDSGASDPSDPIVPGAPGVPDPPTVELTGPGTVTLTWADPADGSSVNHYSVQPSPASPATVASECSDPGVYSCDVSGLNSGTSYTFKITAHTSLGVTRQSAASEAVVPAAPGTPAAPTVVVTGSGTATVSWSAPVGGGPINGYSVIPDPAATIPAGCGDDVTVRTCTFTGLSPTTAYTFQIEAVGPAGNTDSLASAPVVPGAPAAPGTPSVNLTSVGSATVFWAASTGAGPVTSYTLTSNQPINVPAGCTALNTRSCALTGLDPTLSYTFQVTATGPAGSTQSAISSPAVKPDAPGVPGTPTVTLTAPGQATVAWTAPATGGPVSSYTLTSNQAINLPGGCTAARSCTFTDLDPTLSYTFTATAVGALGSTPSASTTALKPAAPAAAGTPTVTLTSPGNATVAWTASTSAGPVTSYTLTSNQAINVPAGCTAVGVRSCVFTDLNPALSYTFQVNTTGPAGSTPSASSSAVIPDKPGASGTPTVTVTSPGHATVTWTASTTGGPLTSYTLTSNQPINVPAGCTDLTVRNCVFTDLDPTLSYTFQVSAVGPAGFTLSPASSPAVKPDKPGVPGTPTVQNSVPGSVTVSWTAPTTGGVVTSYSVTSLPDVTPPVGCTAIAGLTCVFSGLDPNQTYGFLVTATGPGGSTPSVRSDQVTPGAPAPPGTPTAAVIAVGTARVTWAASPPGGGVVSGYTVTSDPAVSPPAACILITALTCDFNGLDPTKSYTFAVTAVGGAGRTTSVARSVPVIPAAAGVPGTPTAQVTGAGTAKISWTKPPGGGPVTSFSVTSSPVVTPPAGCTQTVETTCDFTGLDAATSYTFLVTANGPAGNTPSAARSNAVRAAAPGTPGTPTVAPAGPGAVTVQWTAPDPSSGGQVTGYTVVSDPAIFAPPGCTNTSQLSCVFSGLDPNRTYGFLVTAIGPGGNTPSASSGQVTASAPNPPGTPTATVVSAGTVRVTWTASPPGGGVVSGYTVTSDPAVTPPAACTLITALTCDFNGLDPTKSYTFAVTAVGGAGRTTSVARSPAVMPTAPNAPGTPTAQVVGAGTAKVSWTRSFGGGPMTSFSVTSDPVVTPPAACTLITTTTCEFTGLDAATSYTFLVTSNGPAGNTPSAARSNAVTAAAPGTPGTPTVALAGPGAVTVQWTAPTTGGPVAGYSVVSDPPIVAPPGCTQVLVLSCTFDRLVGGVSYTFKVIAAGPVGSPATSAVSAAVIPGPPPVPGKPTVALTAVANQVRVSWTPSVDGAPVAGYVVQSAPGGIGCDVAANAAATSCLVSSLDPATAYSFRVQAQGVGNSGDSAFSPRSDAIAPGALTAPTEVDVAAGDRQIAVSWVKPANAGDRVAYYRATANPGGVTCRTPDAAGTDCIISGLYNLTSYTVTVVAVGNTGVADSPASAPSMRVRPTAGLPGAPTNVVASSRDQAVLVSWRAPTVLGDGIARYVATANGDPDGLTCVTAELSCTISGLVNGRQYKISVVAVGRAASGISPPSTPPVVVTLDLPPSVPTGVTATAGSSDLTVRFTAGAGGGPVVNFTATATGGTSTGPCTTASATATTCVITGVTPGTSYTVTVVANGANLRSAASAPSSAVVALAAPAPALPATLPTGTTPLTSSLGASLKLNQVTTISGTGFQPFSGVTVGYYPGPVTSATAIADVNGTFSVAVSVSGATGSRTLVAAGTKSGTLRYLSLPVTVSVAATASVASVNAGPASAAAGDTMVDIRRRIIGRPTR